MAKRAQTPLLTATAASLGSALGHIAARLSRWKAQRLAIEADLNKIIRHGRTMLEEVGEPDGDQSGPLGDIARVRPRKGGRPKGYKMSAETKAKLRDAWRRRKEAASAQTTSADERSRIRATDGKRFTARQRGRG